MSRPSPEKLVQQLDWNLLRSFLVIVQEGGITPAARRMSLQQPAVSLALKRLEERLEERLIERRAGLFRVTPAGEMLYQECVRIYGSVSRLASALRDIGDELTGHIHLAHASHVSSPVIDEVLADLHQRYPRITYSIDVFKSSQIARMLLDQQASFGLILVNQQQAGLEYLQVYRECFNFYCGPRHRLFGCTELDAQDLKGEATVSFSADILSDVLRSVAIKREELGFDAHIVGTSTHLEEVRRMIIAGLGIGPMPMHIAARDVRDGLLWPLLPATASVPMDVHLVWNPAMRFNRAESALLEAFQQAVGTIPLAERIYG